jgi:endoglucanase
MHFRSGKDGRDGGGPWRRIVIAGVLATAMGTVGLPALAASPAEPSSTTHYDFESGAQGWTGTNVSVAQDRTRAAHGAASLRLSRKAEAKVSTTTLRAHDGRGDVRDLARHGDTVSAWALLPLGTAGSNWRVRLEIQGSDLKYHSGAAVDLVPGQWVQVSYAMPAAVAAQARRFAVQFEVTNARGNVAVNLDTHQQRPATPAPLPSAPSPSAPTPSAPPAAAPVPASGAQTHYTFDSGTQGWTGEASAATADSTRAAHGTGSLRLTQHAGSGWTGIRAFDAHAELRDLTTHGDTVSAWALLPQGTAGTGWRARLDVQDENWAYHAGPSVALTQGQWVQVSYTMPTAVAQRARRFAVQFEVTGANSTVSVNLDTHQQGSTTATTPAAPLPAASTPTPASPTPATVPVTEPSPETASPAPSRAVEAPAASLTGLRTSGGAILDASGRPVRLLGVNHSGTEYACSQGWGFFDGPSIETVSAPFFKPLTDWKVNAVRVPLNEHCWLDINSNIPANRRGAAYQKVITDYVKLINAAGMVAILDLHWHAPGTRRTDNNPMSNRDNSPRFWTSVASHFKGNPAVVFELVNEPHPDGNRNTTEAWRCWRDGGTCTGVVDRATGQPYQVAGMQELVNAVRSTGADQLILAGGIQYTNRLSRWLEYRPKDPMNNIAAAWHVYNFNGCISKACYDAEVGPVAAQVPVVVTELGPDQPCMECKPSYTGFSNQLLDWLDAKQASYQAWTWNRWSGDPHVLNTDWVGTPTEWGTQFKARLAANAAR